jgi:hypothetical protein
MRANACLSCLLLAVVLAAAPLSSIAISQAQPAAGDDMAPSPDDDEEDGGNDTAEREERPTPGAARHDYQLGSVRRADGFEADAAESGASEASHPMQLAHPEHDVVVCEAGCDGPAGTIVYLQKRQPRQVE